MRMAMGQRSGVAACLVAGWLLACGLRPAAASATNVPPTAAVAALPAVNELMAGLLARLPSKPILITGELVTTPVSGPKSKLGIDILLSYPRMARYTLRDAFGRQSAQMTLTRNGSTYSCQYQQGESDPVSQAPAMGEAVADTALSWMDLTLGFLWWDGGVIIGREENRGQLCYVLDRHAPRDQTSSYASVRMWVDTRVSMLMQAEGYDKLGNCMRRLSVKSFKKINDEWMIKDLEVENLASSSKTILRVKDARPVDTDDHGSAP